MFGPRPIRLNASRCVGDRFPREINLCLGDKVGVAFKLQLRSYDVHRDDRRFRAHIAFQIFVYGTFLGVNPNGYGYWARKCCSNGITLFYKTIWACRDDFYMGGRLTTQH